MPELEEKPEHTGGGEDIAKERTEAELDALADQSEKATNRERPMKEEAPKASTPKEELYEFVHNGKSVKATKDQLVKWAQQGYDYPQKAQRLNQEREKWIQEKQGWEKQWGVYKEIDSFAQQNKDWWNYVQQAWQNRGNPVGQGTGAPQQGSDPYTQKFQFLEEKLSQIEPVIQTVMEKERAMQERLEDEELDKEVQSIRSSHKDLDWDSLDEHGKSLETKVLEHAQKIGTQSFRAAFRDLLHDDLVTKAQSAAKLAVSHGIQKRTKLGVLGTSPTPTKGSQRETRDIRKTSYEDIMADIREDLKAGRLP